MRIAGRINAVILNALLVLLFAISPAYSAPYEANVASLSPSENSKRVPPVAYVNSDKEAYAAMQELPVDEPIYMLNMIRYNGIAKYEGGSEFATMGWSGSEAYEEYGRHSSPIAKRVGGSVTYLGKPQLTFIGPEYEQWDAIFIISYPNLKSFLALVTDPEYKKHAFHRRAAVADSRLVRMASVARNHFEANPEDSAKTKDKKEQGEAYIQPTQEAVESMLKLPVDEPIFMLNMIRLKDKADYQKGSKFAAKNWTGAQAYAKYRSHAGSIVARLGGKSIFEGDPQLTLIGPEKDQWDSIFIIYYPNVAALKALTEDPEYKAHAFHRDVGVADSRLIRMTLFPTADKGPDN